MSRDFFINEIRKVSINTAMSNLVTYMRINEDFQDVYQPSDYIERFAGRCPTKTLGLQPDRASLKHFEPLELNIYNMGITILIAFALCIVGAVVWFFFKNKKTSQEEVINKPSEPVSEPSAPPVNEVSKEDEKEPEKPTEEEVKPVEEEVNPTEEEIKPVEEEKPKPDAPTPPVIQEEKPKYNEEYEGYLDKYSQFAKI